MWSVSDDALLAGLATGDPEAAAAFVERFQRRVYGLALALVGDSRTAEDVAQETLLRAWRHAAAYDPRRGSVATWLLAIGRNLAIDILRLRRPTVLDPEAILDLGRGADEPSPADWAVANDDAQRLRSAIAELPSDQRRALVLSAFFGQTAREIGESEGIPLGTAKTRIRTAMLRLRAALVTEGRAE